MVLEGMSLRQLIAMLTAAEAQGGTRVALAAHGAMGLAECTGIDWVSPAPIAGVVYISPLDGAMQVMSNEAAESVDW